MRNALVSVMFLLLLCFIGCNTEQPELTTEASTSETTSAQLSISFMPHMFASIVELQEFISNPELNDMGETERAELLRKAALTEITLEGYTLSQIYYRPSTYIAAYYSDDDYVYTDKYDEYEHERLSTAICGVYPYYDTELALQDYIDKGYNPVTIDGRQYYYSIEYSFNGNAIGYELVFVEDDSIMYVHLPYTGQFKELPHDAT